MEQPIELGLTIKSLRKKNRITLKELSEKSGISFSQIAKIEKGIHTPSKETLKKLAKGLSYNELILWDIAGYKVEPNEISNGRNKVDNLTKYLTFLKYDLTCQICGGKAPDVSIDVDHITPLNLNGKNEIENLIVLCKDCLLGRKELIEKEGIENDYFYKTEK
jgi:transcriptional regulator with XRE-family HTH domain